MGRARARCHHGRARPADVPRSQVLRLFHEGHGAERVCRVRGDWRECFIDVGDYVNVIGEVSVPVIGVGTRGASR